MSLHFALAFLSVLPSRPAQALDALYWYVTGRKVRGRNRLRLARQQAPGAYRTWIEQVETPANAALPAPAGQAGPRFSVILHNTGGEAARTIATLEGLAWPDWELVVVPGLDAAPFPPAEVPRTVIAPVRTDNAVAALEAGIAAASGDFVVPLAAGAALAPRALDRLAEACAAHPEASVLYGDHDWLDARGQRTRPWFKPRWNPEMFLAQDYLSPACAIRATAARAALPLANDSADAAVYALLLAATAAPGASVVHVPHVLAHLRESVPSPSRPARLAALARHLAGTGATLDEGPGDTTVVHWPLPAERPLVTIIIPTRDNLALVRACVHSVLTETRYKPFEVLIVDNGSIDPETLAYFRRVERNPAVRVLRHVAPFNFSAINNVAVRAARGQYLCLLNDDTEVLDGQWLGAMMRHATRPHVGAVGARLLYDDGSIQHAGVVIGMGDAAGHAHRFQKPGDAGYFHRADIAHTASAVTAACLLVAREKYEAVGGLDEEAFAVAFNDVDFCLKLQKAGWHNLYCPQATLVHHESKSRGSDVAPSQIERFHRELATLRARWQTETVVDPLHHPHLDRESEAYIIRL